MGLTRLTLEAGGAAGADQGVWRQRSSSPGDLGVCSSGIQLVGGSPSTYRVVVSSGHRVHVPPMPTVDWITGARAKLSREAERAAVLARAAPCGIPPAAQGLAGLSAPGLRPSTSGRVLLVLFLS